MKSSIVLASSWLAADPRRSRAVVAGVAVILVLLGLSTGYEDAFAGLATGGPH